MNIGIIEISAFSDSKLYTKYTNTSMYSIMPQVIGVYAKRLGHKVWYYPYFGDEDLYKNLNFNLDIVFISCYTKSAYIAYSISNLYRSKGITTIIGGPHARSFPEDCRKHFDFVIGVCDFSLISDLLKHYKDKDILGTCLSSKTPPDVFPSLNDRWEFLEKIFNKSTKLFYPTITLLSSTGCPNDCSFCIDSKQKYNYLPTKSLYKDLLFLKEKKRKFNVFWHDPNFGIKFDTTMNIIEDVNAKNLYFAGEVNIQKLTEENCKRLQKNNFWAMGPGLESWKDYNKKSIKDNNINNPLDKVEYISEQMRMVNKYIPIIQLNIIFGLDIDTQNNGFDDAFDLTKLFIYKTPGVYVNFQTLTIFGESTPMGEDLNKENRLLNIPYNLLDGFSVSNVKLKCDPSLFYKSYANLLRVEKSFKVLRRRISNCNVMYGKIFYLLKSLTGRLNINHFEDLSKKIKYDKDYYNFFNGISNKIPKELSRRQS